MNKKLSIFLALFVMLGIFGFIKVNATSLDLSSLQADSSCTIQTIQNCDRNGLIMILIQLILQTPTNSSEPTDVKLPDLYIYSDEVSYTQLRDKSYGLNIVLSNAGESFNTCDSEVEIIVVNLDNQKSGIQKINPGLCSHSSMGVADPIFLGKNMQKTEFGFPLTDLGLENNDYAHIKVILDPNNKIKELNENNNSHTTYVGTNIETKPILKNYSKFSATEVEEDNLPESITLWAAAYCPNQGYKNYVYTVPEGYELVSCEMGGVGTHKGCSYCAMAKIKLKAKASAIGNSYIKIKNTSFNNLCKGDTFKIAWETDFDKVMVGYERKNISGHFASLGEYDKNTTSIDWKAGTDLQGNYFNVANGEEEIRLKITARNNDITRYAYSQFFKLTDCGNPAVPSGIEKKFLSPTANTELCKGKSTVIKWQGEKDSTYNLMIASEEGTTSWSLANNLKTDANGIGEFNWTIGKYYYNQKDLSASKFKFYAQGTTTVGTTLERITASDYITISDCVVDEGTVCIDLYDPVCGANGQTYSNECLATQAGTTVNYKGECSSRKVSPCPPKGDANQDGYITEEDYTLLANCSVGNCASNMNKDNCDLNGNGTIDIGDAANLDYFLKGKVNTFNACTSTEVIPSVTVENTSGSILDAFKNFFEKAFSF